MTYNWEMLSWLFKITWRSGFSWSYKNWEIDSFSACFVLLCEHLVIGQEDSWSSFCSKGAGFSFSCSMSIFVMMEEWTCLQMLWRYKTHCRMAFFICRAYMGPTLLTIWQRESRWFRIGVLCGRWMRVHLSSLLERHGGSWHLEPFLLSLLGVLWLYARTYVLNILYSWS